jgi:hypothetical protein
MNFGDNLITNLLSCFSVIVASFTLWFYLRDRKRQKYQIVNDYTKLLIDWHCETVETLIKLRNCLIVKDDVIKQELLCRLSSQIERGRFHFPNIDKGDGFGRNKPIAYQGYRNLTLDFLVYSYNLFCKENCNELTQHAVVLQREFTSNVFQIVRPKENLDEIKKLTDKFYTSEKIFEDFFHKNPESVDFLHYKNV